MFIAKSITLASMLAVIGACSSSTAKKNTSQTDRAAATALPALGSFELEDDDIELGPKSAIAFVSGKKSAKTFTIAISSNELAFNEDSFKEPADYECLPCKGEDDPRCGGAEDAEGNAYLMLLFSGEAVSAKTGLPSKKSDTLEGDPLKDLTAGLLVSFMADDTNPKKSQSGIGKVKFDSMPALDEEMTVSLDLKFKKKALSGDVTTLAGTMPSPLKTDCEDEEYVKFIYEE
jgi:hypothetical protein